jgi:hypothetical protein
MNLDHLLILLSEIDIDNAGQQEKQSLESYLKRLLENIFRLQYWELEQGRNYKYWHIWNKYIQNSIKMLSAYVK